MTEEKDDQPIMSEIPRRRFVGGAGKFGLFAAAGGVSAIAAACGDDDDEPASTEAPAETGAPATDAPAATDGPADTTAGTEAPAVTTPATPVSDEPIKVGILLPTSGPYASLGDHQSKGIRLALGDSVAGREIEYVDLEENLFAPQESIQLLQSNSDVDVFVGVIGGGTALAVRDTIHDMEKPLLVTNAVTRAITGSRKSPYIYRASTTGYQAGINLGPWMFENLGGSMDTAAPDYASGHELTDYPARFFEEAGGKVISQYFPPLGNADYAAVLTEIASTDSDFVYSFFAGADAVRWVSQYAEFGLDEAKQLIGLTLVNDLTIAEQGDAAEGVMILGGWSRQVDTPENVMFMEDFNAAYGEEATGNGSTGFNGGTVLKMAIEAVGGDVENVEAFSAAIGEVEFTTLLGRDFHFDPATHNSISFQTVEQIQRQEDGSLIPVEIAELGEAVDPGDDVDP